MSERLSSSIVQRPIATARPGGDVATAIRGRFRRAAVVLVAAATLSGCVTTGAGHSTLTPVDSSRSAITIDPSYQLAPEQTAGPIDPTPEADLRYVREAAKIAMDRGAIAGAAVHLSRLYDESPRDRRVIYDYARHLRYIGALNEAGLVLNDGLAIYPDDPLLRLESAKASIAEGDAEAAVITLTALRADHPRDPSVLKTLGVAFDRLGDHMAATEAYEAAMAVGRPTAPLLNNAGLSRLLAGDLDRAEALLREALSSPGAGPQVRQNLALTLSLKGDEAGARLISAQAVPEPLARKTVSAFSQIGREGHAWDHVGD